MRFLALLSPVVVVLLTGCLSQGEVAPPRYFQPRLPETDAVAATSGRRPLGFGRVTDAPHLEVRMAWRVSEVELGFDDLDLWAADPSALVQTVLQQRLFADGPFEHSTARGTPIVSVHVQAFEGDTVRRLAILQLLATATHAGKGKTHIIRVEKPLEAADGPSLALSTGLALHDAIEQLKGWLLEQGQ